MKRSNNLIADFPAAYAPFAPTGRLDDCSVERPALIGCEPKKL
jgi:hypothetical protein